MFQKAYSYIRFSTPEQRKGDSLRRQTEFSERYAAEHGLVLDSSLRLQDLGLSAYKGEHRSDKGALGQFLKLVEMGKIEKGSVLLVESLDRLSREEITEALEQFLAIIGKGIKIVTLIDKREYTKETVNNNFSEMMFSLMTMARAHEESSTKAMRLGKAWEGKRKQVGFWKLTARCPAWLKLRDDKTQFDTLRGPEDAIRRIFDMKLAGKGATTIIRELNSTPEIWKPGSTNKRKRGEGWRESYVKKILQNRAVIGEFQPHRLFKGKRQPIGNPISDYFPSVIDKDVFYRVQEQIRQNVHKGGQTGTVSNLFSHIVKCGYCGGSLAYVDKGPAPRGGQYLVCDRARRGLGCSKTSVKYSEFERLVLSYCKGLNAQDILDRNDDTAINLLKKEYDGITGELGTINKEIENIADSISSTSDKRVREILDKRMTERFDKKASLNQAKDRLKQQIDTESMSFENMQLTLDTHRECLYFLETEKTGKKLIDIRRKLRNEMKKLIDRIDVYPEGLDRISPESAQKALKAMTEFVPEGTEEYAALKKYYLDRIEHPKQYRSFKIIFKSDSIRIIYPTGEQYGTDVGLDFDTDERIVQTRNLGKDGRLIIETQDDNRRIVKHYKRSIRPNGKEVLHEIIDIESAKAQVMAQEVFRFAQRAVE
jgi:DNA invertase Pin-like site-specific DNA recombinase/ElaB/YqjD/DUF883 family membrane-anchored ribosome-binding protein